VLRRPFETTPIIRWDEKELGNSEGCSVGSEQYYSTAGVSVMPLVAAQYKALTGK
jgi:hypothetical protein